MKTPPKLETLYVSDDKIVTVIRKNRGLRRYSKHADKCVILLLRPTKNTRVCVDKNGLVEYLATFDEMKAMLGAIDPEHGKRSKFAQFLEALKASWDETQPNQT